MKKSQPIRYLFIDPNSPETFESVLKEILIEKLLAESTDSNPQYIQNTYELSKV